MSRPKSLTMTDGELRLMQVLWEKGQATVGEVVDAVTTRPKPAYNTVLTLLRIMEKKGYVTHRKEGRAFIFVPNVARADASRSALRSVLNRFFDGSPKLLMLNLLEDAQLSPEALKQLKDRIEDA
ncbi:MAG TPA: BlaI/MecI/CopY family transcriptional regulator [Vicinamibacterales bacterium]|nr:BlaI/MecI/CopY family transcriptional regulator [Vicinamibacterales bacterium]